MALKITDLGTTLTLHRRMYYLPKFDAYIKDGTPNFNDGTPIIFKVESQGPPNIQLGVKPCICAKLCITVDKLLFSPICVTIYNDGLCQSV